MSVNVTKISQRMKNKSLMSAEKNIKEWAKSNDLEIFKAYKEIEKKLWIYFKKFILTKKVENYKLKN